MKKTMSIALITLGIILIIIGIITLNPKKENQVQPQIQIPSVQAEKEKTPTSGTPTSTLDNQIKEKKTEENQLTENEQKGQKFEEYVVTHFNKKNFTLKEWRSDKYIKGHYAKSNQYPDLELEFHLKNGTSETIVVECKYRKGFLEGKVSWCEPDQLERYRTFIEERNVPTFLIIGIGGSPDAPENVYIFNIAHMKGNIIYEKNLERYAHDPVKNFFYDQQKKQLR